MVFGEGYDNSLWLVLASDDANRKRIAECIAKMPREVLVKIQEIIKESQGKDKVYVESTSEYYFCLRIKNGILNIHLDKSDKKGLVGENFALSLIPIDKKMLMSRRLYSKEYIGWFMESKKDTVKSAICEELTFEDVHMMDIEYKLIYTPFGTILKTHFENDKDVKPNGYYGVKVKRIPDKIFVHQLEDENKLNRMVRKRTKK